VDAQSAAPAPGDEPDPDDRANGPGWSDWAYKPDGTTVPAVWPDNNADTIETGKFKRSREGWWRVVCTWLDGKEDASLKEARDALWWFHLRLTRREAADAMQSAYVHKLIEALDGTVGKVIEHPDVRWACTDEGRKLARVPRGAGEGDFLSRLTEGVAAWKIAAGLVAIFTTGVVATVVAWFIAKVLPTKSDKLLASEIALVAIAVGWIWLLSWAALRDERILTAMMRSWTRCHASSASTAGGSSGRWRSPWRSSS
jgi:hypothetical protein